MILTKISIYEKALKNIRILLEYIYKVNLHANFERGQ